MKNELEQGTVEAIFAMHLGCEVVTPDPYHEAEELKGYLTGIYGEYQAEVQHIDENGNAWEDPEYHDFNVTKLQLSLIKDLTDEHALAIARLCIDTEISEVKKIISDHNTYSIFFEVVSNGLTYGFGFDVDGCLEISMIKKKNWIEATTPGITIMYVYEFLRQHSYAIPLYRHGKDAEHINGKTAIELGYAIDKNKKP